MMRHLLEIGRVLYREGGGLRLEELVEEVKKGTLYLLDLYPQERRARLVPYQLDGEKCRRFLWVGDPPQSQAQRDRVTTKELRYLVGQVPGALAEDPGLWGRLGHLVWQVGKGKYGHVLDLRGYRLEGAWEVPRKEGRPFWVEGGTLRWEEKDVNTLQGKELGESLAKTLEEAWRIRAAKGEGLLFSLALEGSPVADWPEYREYLRRLLLDRPFQGAREGVCHGCGVRAPVTPETAPFRYKFYITDKKNFAPGLVDEAFPKALALCRECFASLLLGERFAEARLEIPFLGVRALVLPEGEGRQDPKALANRVERLLAQVRDLEEVEDWKEFLQRVGPDGGSGFLGFSLVLFERKQASTKVQEAVYEVPPSRVEALFQAMRESQWLRPWGGEVQGLGEWRELLEEGGNALALRVAVHLLGGVPLERGFLLPHLLATAKVALWRGQKGPGEALRLLALGAGWIWVLRRLGMLREEGTERAWAGDVDREYRKRFEEYGFGPLRAGLYLLGVALERVGHAQAQAAEYKKEPLLESIGWEGMSLPEVRHLVQRAVDRAAYYLEGGDLAGFLEVLGMATDLVERGEERLSQREIPYYLLMGYAQARAQRLQAGKAKKMEEVAHGE